MLNHCTVPPLSMCKFMLCMCTGDDVTEVKRYPQLTTGLRIMCISYIATDMLLAPQAYITTVYKEIQWSISELFIN